MLVPLHLDFDCFFAAIFSSPRERQRHRRTPGLPECLNRAMIGGRAPSMVYKTGTSIGAPPNILATRRQIQVGSRFHDNECPRWGTSILPSQRTLATGGVSFVPAPRSVAPPVAPPCQFKRQVRLGFNNYLRSALTLRGVSSAHNLRRLASLVPRPRPARTLCSAYRWSCVEALGRAAQSRPP